MIDFDVNLTDTISLLELLRVLVGVLGLYFSTANWFDCRASLRAALEPPEDPAVTDLARMSIPIHGNMMLVQFVLTLTGLLAWTVPTTNPSWVRMVSSIFLIVLGFLLLWNSYKVRLFRARAMAIVAKDLNGDKPDLFDCVK